MPALGMAQDTGLIVAWRKAPGETVKADDILMEVETDKATVEIEAGRAGTLAELRAEPGVPVPVGETVAVIALEGETVAATPPAAAKPEPQSAPQPAPAPARATSDAPVRLAVVAGRVLASPKARMEASRRGIDLAALVRAGLAQPVHHADLERAPHASPAPAQAAPSVVRKDVPRASFDDFARWAQEETVGSVPREVIWAAFAGAALRGAVGTAPDRIVVEAACMGTGTVTALDPDLMGLTAVAAHADAAPDLRVADVAALTDYRPGTVGAAPVLVVTGAGDALVLSLHFAEDAMPLQHAALLLDRLAERVADPLRHLL